MQQHFERQTKFPPGLPDQFSIHGVVVSLLLLFTSIFIPANLASGSMDLSDEPILSQIKPAPANIMILLDDSGSMTFEVLTTDNHEGRFPDSAEDGSDGFGYIFDYPENPDHPAEARTLGESGRKIWKSQSHEFNHMYYNPTVKYDPWPGYGHQNFQPADMEFPRFHPLKKDAGTLDLDGKSFSVTLEIQTLPIATLQVKHAHYFQQGKNSEVYLVVLDGDEKKIKYYEITQTQGSGMTETVNRVRAVSIPPADIQLKEYRLARQNFANWFTYHRCREFVAKGAIARVIKNIQGVRVGFLGLNGSIIVPLKPVGVWQEGLYIDDTRALLEELYAYDSGGDTPLREGLDNVGQYYLNNSNRLTHYSGKSAEGKKPPYFSEADGGACQQSFTVIMTDGYYDYQKCDLKVGNADGNDQSLYDGGSYSDNLSETLADVAMYYYENDLSPDREDRPAGKGLPDRVYDPQRINKSILDKAPHQHMVTFGVGFGVSGNLDPQNYEVEPGGVNFFNNQGWPDMIEARSKETIDDLLHATVNGRGRFLTARDPQALVDALTEVLGNVLNRQGSSSAALINRDAQYGQIGEDILLFQAGYRTEDWSGDLKAYRVDPVNGAILSDDPAWSAVDNLDFKPWNQRKILSYDGSSGIEFDETQLSDTQKNNLGPDFRKIVRHIKGEKIDGYRIRTTILGDIVHSSPVLEDGIIYVGANDGMLHAFEITADSEGIIDGNEIFGYVPGLVFDNLKELANPDYRHRYFVDLTPTVVKGNGILGGESSATVLIGGLGKGGKGYFALDISTPISMAAANVLWEFPGRDDPEAEKDTGYSFAKPLIVRTNSDREDESWAVICANGYDSPNNNAVLFILNPKTGDIIRKIIADNPSVSSGNGLSSPIAVDVNADLKADFVYAGDLKGNMWKFDLTAKNSTQWGVAYNDGTYDQPLFKAEGPGGSEQPITAKPEVMFHPGGHGLMVLFGTGRLLGNSDFSDQNVQTVYGIWDYGDRVYFPGEWGAFSNDDDQEYLGSFIRPRLSNQPKNVTLLRQTSESHSIFLTGQEDNPGKVDLRVMTTRQPTWVTMPDNDSAGEVNFPDLSDIGTSHAGWYYDLPLEGERIISDVTLRDGRLTVICVTPGRDRCSDGSSSFFMELNAFTGGSIPVAAFDINEDGVIDERDTLITGYGNKDTPVRIPPAGIKMPGNLQPPVVLRLNSSIEVNYLSTSYATVQTLREQAERLGVIYWKELEQ